jgi:hypothetical protein
MVVVFKSIFLYKQLLPRLWLPGSSPENSREAVSEAFMQKAKKAEDKKNNDERMSYVIYDVKNYTYSQILRSKPIAQNDELLARLF